MDANNPDYIVRKGGIFRAIGRYFKENFTGEYPSAASASDDSFHKPTVPIDKRVTLLAQEDWDLADENTKKMFLATAAKDTMEIAKTYLDSDYDIEYDEPHERLVLAIINHGAICSMKRMAERPFGIF